MFITMYVNAMVCKYLEMVKDSCFLPFPVIFICFAESVWGRYFENNKVEGTINTDLARLYPEEHGSFFQSKTCQAILKRVLLVWALIHPQYGYRQGTMA